MQRTYTAILHGDRVEWLNGKPEENEPVQVQISVLEDERIPTQGEELARLLGALADKGTFSDIEDPVAWQREQRKDRQLPGREL